MTKRGTTMKPDSKLTDEQWDNLIAAAPAMYEALKALTDHFINAPSGEWLNKHWKDAIAAIAKAEGRS